MLQDRIQTKGNLLKRRLTLPDNNYSGPFCSQHLEIVQHLFLSCTFSQEVGRGLQQHILDSWKWLKSAYGAVCDQDDIFMQAWNIKVPPKLVNIFLWRLLRNRLPSGDSLKRKNVEISAWL
ncbi:hypothetical protein GmHk_13G037569 [Glycine max]|nr:hypothetical protein GmHk_13G037569 [Glycine max]